jgi:hypothetical protein
MSYYIENEDVVSCYWGEWSEQGDIWSIPLTTTGLSAGSTEITLLLQDYATDIVLDSVTVYVTVTQSGADQ